MSGTNVTTAAVQSQPKQKRHLVRTLGKSLREYRKPSILTPIFVVVEGVLEILIPTVMASLIDEGITGKSMPAIVKFGLILLACSLCSLAAGFLAGKFAAIAGAGFAKNLRHDEFEKVQGFSFTNIDKFSTGSIITRLTTDVTNLQNAYSMIIRLGVRAPIMMIVAWIFSFRISPSISLVFLACIPVLAFGLCGLAVYVHPVFERVFHTYAKLNNVVWTNYGPFAVDDFALRKLDVMAATRQSGAVLAPHVDVNVLSIDKFPRMVDYVVPTGVRIGDADRVRLGAHLSEGTTVMHAGFVNFNAGTLGVSMVEGRVSQGVVVGNGSDIGGGASIMGTLSGGGKLKNSIGEHSLLGANAGIGISLGDNCVVEAGLYVTAGTKVTIYDKAKVAAGEPLETVKGAELSGKDNILFIRNSVSGRIEARYRKTGIELNEKLHKN